MATLTIHSGCREQSFEGLPANLLDLTISGMEKAGIHHSVAVAIMSVGLKLYAHGKVALGYDLEARIEGQL